MFYIGYFKDDMIDGFGKMYIHIGDDHTAEFTDKSQWMIQEGEFQLGTLVSSQIDNYYMCQEKI